MPKSSLSFGQGPRRDRPEGKDSEDVESSGCEHVFRTRVEAAQSHPTWNETFQWTLDRAPEQMLLEISLWDSADSTGPASAKFVGQAVLELGKLDRSQEESVLMVDVLSCHVSLAHRGAQLTLAVGLNESRDGRELHQDIVTNRPLSSPPPCSKKLPQEKRDVSGTRQQVHLLQQQLQKQVMHAQKGASLSSPAAFSNLHVSSKVSSVILAGKNDVQGDFSARAKSIGDKASQLPNNNSGVTPATRNENSGENAQLQALLASLKEKRKRLQDLAHEDGSLQQLAQEKMTRAATHKIEQADPNVHDKHAFESEARRMSSNQVRHQVRDRIRQDKSEGPTGVGSRLDEQQQKQLTGEAKEALLKRFVDVAPRTKMFSRSRNALLIHRLCNDLTAFWTAPNTTIIQFDTEGSSMFFLMDGKCSVHVTGKIVGTLAAPCHFGEVALLSESRRTAEIRSISACLLCEISRDDLRDVLNEFPSEADIIYHTLKLEAIQKVQQNSAAATTIERHHSAVAETDDPLAAFNLSDRRQRILNWHKNYDQNFDGGQQEGEENDETSSQFFHKATSDPIQAAMRISGVSEHVVSVVQNMEMFKGAPPRAHALLIAKMTPETFEKGDMVIEAGTTGTSMYIVDSGRLQVLVNDECVEELGMGNFFGEVAILSRQKRTATVVALEKSKLLQLKQDSIWTVCNVFPAMLKVMKEVASKRVKANPGVSEAQECQSLFTGLGLFSPKKTGIPRAKSFRVKFRAPFDRFTPEDLGVNLCSYFTAGFPHVALSIHTKADHSTVNSKSSSTRADRSDYYFKVHLSGICIFESNRSSASASNGQVIWHIKEPFQNKFYRKDHVGVLSLTFFRLKWGLMGMTKSEQIIGGARIALEPLLRAPNRTLTQSLQIHSDSQAKGCARSESSGTAPRAGAERDFGSVQLVLTAWPDVVEPFVIRVPLCHPPGEHLAAITDHTGKQILFMKARSIPASESDGPGSCFCSSIVDLVSPDGSHKGQVATDVTNGRHARSRLANNWGLHWATVKSKQVSSRQTPSSHQSRQTPSSHQNSRPQVETKFKVVPTFKELSIGECMDKKHGVKSVMSNNYSRPKRRAFDVHLDRGGEHLHCIGRIVLGDLADCTHTTVRVNPGEDVICCLLVAIGILESQRLAPAVVAGHSRNPFERNYSELRDDKGITHAEVKT